MLRRLISSVNSSRGFLVYFALTYTDKLLSFFLPLFILFFIKQPELYAFVEVAFSYAVLILVLADFGLSGYLFYGYRAAENKPAFLADSREQFSRLFGSYFFLCLAVAAVLYWTGADGFMLAMVICVRVLFSLYTTFYASVYRLEDRPSRIYATTITVNVLSIALAYLASLISPSNLLLWFFMPPAVFVAVQALKPIGTMTKRSGYGSFGSFFRASLLFSWPIILNVLTMAYINNHGKIYAYGHLSEAETVEISYVLRIGMIVQLTHSAFASFYSKALFMDGGGRFNFRIFSRYNAVLLLSAAMVLLLIAVSSRVSGGEIVISLRASTFLFIAYILLWCYIGYLEIYFGVKNSNKSVLLYSLVASFLYTILLLSSHDITLLKLAIFMVCSAAVNLTLVIIGLYRLKVLGGEREGQRG
jgi:hypothetical protein